MSGYFDIHSHILPGLDDGAKSLDDSKEMLYIAYDNGINHIIATPHYRENRFTSGIEEIQGAYNQVKDLIAREGLDISLYLGNEIYYSHDTSSLLIDGKILTMADSDYVLLEFSPASSYPYIKTALSNIIMSGYWPILAHFERYDNLVYNWEYIDEIINMGVLIQINSSTITGSVLAKPTRLVKKLLKYDLVDFIATDTHNNSNRAPSLEPCITYLGKKYGQDLVNKLLYINPMKIINNEYI